MNETAGGFLHREWPYLALALFAAGFAARLLLTADSAPALKRALPRTQNVFLGGRLWRASWIALAAAHVVGLAFPRAVVAWTTVAWRLYALEVVGFAVGLAVFAACLRTAWLHLRRPARDGWSLLADAADAAFLTLVFAAIASGLLAAVLHRWGSAWAAVTVAPYAASLVHGHPAPAFVEHLPVLVRLHLFTALAAIALFPATRLALIPLVIAHRALAATGRAIAAVTRPALVRVGRKVAAALWPDAEVRWVVRPPADAGRRPAGQAPAVWQQLRGGAAMKHTGDKAV
jgi:nitrate reductase gamma subunit